jgi:CheY-like chemotaxis protein
MCGRSPPFSRVALLQCFKTCNRVTDKRIEGVSGPRMPLLALVIDDSMLIRHTVCRFLEKRGFAVETATDGAAALELLKTIRPDIIFTDLQMPRLSGYELIEALKNNAETAGIPVLILAARPLSGDAPETRAHSVIYKDLNIEVQLRQALESLFPSNATS